MKPTHRFLGLLLIALFSGIGAAQDQAPQVKTRDQADTSRGQQRIVKEVRHELTMLPYYSVFDNLAYKVDGDRVTLMGQVSQPTLKADSERVVKKIEGVSSVDNQIEVLPASFMDDRIRRQVFRAIYSQPVLEKYAVQAVPPIHIIVKNGHVSLEGVVANESEKNIAEIQAKSVPGVFSVEDHLNVEK
jgi:hyperosmotically inducible protein